MRRLILQIMFLELYFRYYISSEGIGAILAAVSALLIHGPGPNYLRTGSRRFSERA